MSNIVGTVELLVVPNTAGFGTALKAETGVAMGGVTKDAERIGQQAGRDLSKGAGAGLKDLGGVLGTVPLGGFSGRMKEAGKSVGELESHSAGLAGTLGAIPTPIAAVGAAAAITGVEAIKLGEGMEHADAAIAGAAGTSVAAASEIGNSFLDTAGKSVFSGQEMAAAFAEVAGQLKSVAGHALKSGEADEFMAAAGALAEARQVSLGTATGALSKVMQTFHLNTRDAGKAADVLYNASKATGVGVDALASTLSRMRSKLGEASGSVGQLSGLIVTMANAGITGRASVSTLSTGLTTLTKDTAKNKEAQKELGLQAFDQNGKFVGLKSVIEQLHPHFAKMTQQQQLAASATLFGSGAARGMLAVINAGPAAFDKSTKSVEKHGSAEKAASQQSKTLHGETQTLKATFSDLGTKLGLVLIPAVTAFGGVLIELIGTVGEVVGFVKKHWNLLGPILTGPFFLLIQALGPWKAGIEHAISGVVGWIKGAWHTVSSATSSLVHNIIGFFSSLPSGIASVAGGVVTWFQGLPGKILGALAGLPGQMLHLGEGIVEGVIHGVEKLAGKLLSTVAHVITSPVEAAAHALGIKSPSTVTTKHGEAIIEGYAAGVQKAAAAHSGSVRDQIVAFFMAKGFTKAQAAGIAGNAGQESSFNPNAPGGGLFQTIGGRGVAQGSSVQAQLVSAWKEMLSRGEVSGLKRTRSPEEAARSFEGSFERAGIPALANRERYAREAFGSSASAATSETPAQKKQTAQQKAELAKQTADQKAGVHQLNKMLEAIHSGSLKTLNKVIEQAHLAHLAKLEKDLDGDHKSALAKLSSELVKVHKEAVAKQAALEKKAAEEAAVKAAQQREQTETTTLDHNATIERDRTMQIVKNIGDATAVTIDRQAEAGLTGTELVAARAQTALDELVQRNDLAISDAEIKQAEAAGSGPLAEAQAAAAVQAIQNRADIEQANDQAALALAQANKGPGGAEPAGAAPPMGTWNFNFIGANPSISEVMTEFGWSLKTGQLPHTVAVGVRP